MTLLIFRRRAPELLFERAAEVGRFAEAGGVADFGDRALSETSICLCHEGQKENSSGQGGMKKHGIWNSIFPGILEVLAPNLTEAGIKLLTQHGCIFSNQTA